MICSAVCSLFCSWGGIRMSVSCLGWHANGSSRSSRQCCLMLRWGLIRSSQMMHPVSQYTSRLRRWNSKCPCVLVGHLCKCWIAHYLGEDHSSDSSIYSFGRWVQQSIVYWRACSRWDLWTWYLMSFCISCSVVACGWLCRRRMIDQQTRFLWPHLAHSHLQCVVSSWVVVLSLVVFIHIFGYLYNDIQLKHEFKTFFYYVNSIMLSPNCRGGLERYSFDILVITVWYNTVISENGIQTVLSRKNSSMALNTEHTCKVYNQWKIHTQKNETL